MNKKIVIVLQIDVDQNEVEGIKRSFEDWRKSAEGAYASRIQTEEVKVQED